MKLQVLKISLVKLHQLPRMNLFAEEIAGRLSLGRSNNVCKRNKRTCDFCKI